MILQYFPEPNWLVLTAAVTSVMWIPYILQLIVQMGPVAAVFDPTGLHPHEAAWAQRAKRAHYNAVENLVVFAVLVIAVAMTETGDALTQSAAMVFFFVRVGHYLVYVAGLPVIRTLLFIAGFGCQAVFVLRLLGAV